MEQVDLFEHIELLPANVVEVINNNVDDRMNYDKCKHLIEQLKIVGYTCDYGLDAVPFGLQRLQQPQVTMFDKTALDAALTLVTSAEILVRKVARNKLNNKLNKGL